jgi:hypothetical protein
VRLDHVALTDLTHFRIYPRNLTPDFTHYFSERSEMSLNNEKSKKAKTMNGNKMKAKIISKILSVKQAFHRLRQYIHWMRSGINC